MSRFINLLILAPTVVGNVACSNNSSSSNTSTSSGYNHSSGTYHYSSSDLEAQRCSSGYGSGC